MGHMFKFILEDLARASFVGLIQSQILMTNVLNTFSNRAPPSNLVG